MPNASLTCIIYLSFSTRLICVIESICISVHTLRILYYFKSSTSIHKPVWLHSLSTFHNDASIAEVLHVRLLVQGAFLNQLLIVLELLLNSTDEFPPRKSAGRDACDSEPRHWDKQVPNHPSKKLICSSRKPCKYVVMYRDLLSGIQHSRSSANKLFAERFRQTRQFCDECLSVHVDVRKPL